MRKTRLVMWFSGQAVLTALTVMMALPCVASASIPGRERRTKSTENNSSDVKGMTVNCSPGNTVIGAGATMSVTAPGKIALVAVRPTASGDGVLAFAREIAGGTDLNWELTAEAICATAGAIPGLNVVTAESESDDKTKGVFARCPDGQQSIGGAAQITNFILSSSSVLDMITPVGRDFDGDGIVDNFSGILASGSAISGAPVVPWGITSFSFCVDVGALDGLESIVSESPFNSFNKGKRATCTGDKVVLGGGAEIFSDRANGAVMLRNFDPALTGGHFFADAVEINDGTPTLADWVVRSYAVCAKR